MNSDQIWYLCAAAVPLGIVLGGILGFIEDVRADRCWEREQRERQAYAREHPDYPMPRPDRVLK